MTLDDVKEYLKSKVKCDNWYIGKMPNNTENCIGIYSGEGVPPSGAIGGLKYSSYALKPISILIHWGKAVSEAEEKAQEIYDAIFGQSGEIGGKRVIMFDMKTSEPIGIGTDDKGIFEYVINFTIHYNKKEN